MTAQLSVNDLLTNVSKLETNDFEVFFREMITIRASRVAPVLDQVESVLIEKIYKKLPISTQNRYDFLTEKRKDAQIDSAEYLELLELVTEFEQHNVERMEAILALANVRKVTVQTLMQNLGLFPLHHG